MAVTTGPGLLGALLVGVQAAKAIAFARGLPLVGVNHLVGHLMSVYLRRADEPVRVPAYPFVALLASGGHTALYEVRSPVDVEQLGQTRDDAAGEAFDKVAKLLSLGYPGGPRVDGLAQRGQPPTRSAFPSRASPGSTSRSRVSKTSLLYAVRDLGETASRSGARISRPPTSGRSSRR